MPTSQFIAGLSGGCRLKCRTTSWSVIMIRETIYNYQLLISIPLGVMISFITIWISQYLLAPRIEFSKDIRCSKSDTNENGYDYSIKVKNRNHRKLVDITVQCRISINDIEELGIPLWTHFELNTTFKNSLYFSKGNRIFFIDINSVFNSSSSNFLEQYFQEQKDNNSLRFEDIFMVYDQVKIQLILLAQDSFTGIKKLYISPDYLIFNINEGKWHDMDLVRD